MRAWIISRPIKAFIIVAFSCAAAFLAFAVWSFIEHPLGRATITREDTPLTVEQARANDCPIALPDSARNVQFACYVDFIDLEVLVRFEASAKICRAHAQQLVDESAAEQKRPSISVAFDSLPQPPKFDLANDSLGAVKWFDVDKITQGGSAIVPIGNYTQLWVDDKRGVFYYLQTD